MLCLRYVILNLTMQIMKMLNYQLFLVTFTLVITLKLTISEWQDRFLTELKRESHLLTIFRDNFLALSVYLDEQRFLQVISMNTDAVLTSQVLHELHTRGHGTLTVSMNTDAVLTSQVLHELHTRGHGTLTVSTVDANSKNTAHSSCEHCTNETVSYLILAENEGALLQQWNQLKTLMIWNFRSRLLIIFTSNCYNRSLINVSLRYRLLLKTLWKKHGIIHVYISYIFDDKSNQTVHNLVFYQPFLRLDKKTFGQVHRIELRRVNSLNGIELHRFSDMNGHPLKISVFDRLSHCFGITFIEVTKICLEFDGFVLTELAKYMNFTPVLRAPTPVNDFGRYYSNGTSTGLLGDVLQGRADIAFNLFFVKHYGTQQIVFTNPVQVDELCIVVPKSKQMPKWLTMLSTFEGDVYAIIMAVYITFAIILIAFKKLRQLYGQERATRIDIVYLMLDTCHPVLNMSITQLSLVSSQRVLATCSLVLGLILVSAFQSKLVATIGHATYYKDIDTLEQLDESGLIITTNSRDMKETFSGSEYPFMHRLTKKIVVVESSGDLSALGDAGNVAAFVRKSLVQLKWQYFRGADGEEILHLVKDCPRSYYLSYILPKVSPYLEKITGLLYCLLESGIVDHWNAQNIQHNWISRPSHALKVFDLVDLQLAFYVLGFGLSIASLTFLFEKTV